MTIYNFSAGPAVLPKDVLQQVQAEMVDWHGSGMSVMEMSHRGKEFMGIAAEAEADLREVMGATNPANAAEGTVRKLFAANIERNAIHGSDAAATAETELRFFFSTADLL